MYASAAFPRPLPPSPGLLTQGREDSWLHGLCANFWPSHLCASAVSRDGDGDPSDQAGLSPVFECPVFWWACAYCSLRSALRSWLTEVEPEVASCCCSPLGPSFDVLWDSEMCFCSSYLYRLVFWVTVLWPFVMSKQAFFHNKALVSVMNKAFLFTELPLTQFFFPPTIFRKRSWNFFVLDSQESSSLKNTHTAHRAPVIMLKLKSLRWHFPPYSNAWYEH